MKKLVLALSLFAAAPAMADWFCEAYCPTGNGYKIITEHDNHPVDALNKVNVSCRAHNGGADSGRIYVSDGKKLVQATVGNACKQIDANCK